MARVAGWNPSKYDEYFLNLSMEQLRAAAEIIAEQARVNAPGRPSKVTRPVYRSGPYAGKSWTARTAGSLKRTVRVVEKYKSKEPGYAIAEARNIRVYAGNDDVYYAAITERSEFASSTTEKPNPHKGWMRRAMNQTRSKLQAMFSQKKAA